MGLVHENQDVLRFRSSQIGSGRQGASIKLQIFLEIKLQLFLTSGARARLSHPSTAASNVGIST